MNKMAEVIRKVDSIMKRETKKNKRELEMASIKPLSKDWLFSTNGVYFFCSKMGGGKTYMIMKHLMITDRLFGHNYYDTIIFSSTSDEMDKTVETLSPNVSTPITNVSDTNLLIFMQKHIKEKMKYYAIWKYALSDGQNVSKIMQKIIDKHKLYRMHKGERIIDIKQLITYSIIKISKWKFNRYPSMSLLIMDDFAGHPLLKDPESPLARMFTKTRHYNLTVILAVQTWRFINLNFKRLCTDIVIWKGFSKEDFEKMIKQTPNDQNWENLWEQYKNLPDQHSHMILHIATSSVLFE